MSYNNLREFIERLEREGELVRVAAEVSPVEEIAELTDRMAKQPGGGKAILFERTGTDFPVVTNLMGSERRMALALGVESLDALTRRIDALLHEVTTPKATLWEKLRMLPLLGEMARWMPRSRRGRGTCQEVVLRGEAARLSLLPVLKCWPEDGGRFVTLPMVHTLDPDTGVRNVGMYRMQVFDDRTTGMHWHVHKTGCAGRDPRPAHATTTTTGGRGGGCPWPSRWAAIPSMRMPRRRRCPTTWTNTCWRDSCAGVPWSWCAV